jgi:pseudaminic acid synthase
MRGSDHAGARMMPFIVAELSANHNGSFDTALKLVEECAKAGANAIKLQTWTPGNMVFDNTLVIDSGPWQGRNMSKLYAEAHTPWEWHKPLFDAAKRLGMVGFSSVFDYQALDFLESIGCPMYKISSFDCVDVRLITRTAGTQKPIVISTGLADYSEIGAAVHAVKLTGNKDLTLLKCTSAYPASAPSINLRSMDTLRRLGNCKAGFSDHTTGSAVAIAATALGADMIEKHVTLDKSVGLDAKFSVEPDELKELVDGCKAAARALGNPATFGVSYDEQPQLKMRKSIYVIKDMHKGERFTPDHFIMARPALGLPGFDYDKLIGRKAKTRIVAGTPMSWNLVL